MRPGANGTFTSTPAVLRSFFDRSIAAKNNQLRQRKFCRRRKALNSFWMASSFCSTFVSSAG